MKLIVGIVGLGVSAFGDPQVGAFISSAAGIIAAAFGVTYSPMRLDTKYDGRFLPPLPQQQRWTEGRFSRIRAINWMRL